MSDSKKLLQTDTRQFDLDTMTQLEMIQNEMDKLFEKEGEEMILIEQKYKKLKQQCYDKRNDVIDKVPRFWFTIFTSHPNTCSLLTEEEEDCLKYLIKMIVDIKDNIKSGYSIKFYFNDNPYFKNNVLIKDFTYNQDSLVSTSTEIEWKKPYPTIYQQVTHSSKDRKKKKRSQTFFTWFSNNDQPANDFISEIIKDDIWPNSLQYYLVPDEDTDDKDDDTTDSSEGEEVTLDNDKVK